MDKPSIAADCMPSGWLRGISPVPGAGTGYLIRRCAEVRANAKWDSLDQLVLEIDGFVRGPASGFDQALVLIHFGDVCWAADHLAWAQKSYEQARAILRLQNGDEYRHSEAAAAYGQGLVKLAIGSRPEALQLFDEAQNLLGQARTHWGGLKNSTEFSQCTQQIKDLDCRKEECGYPTLVSGTTEAPAAPQPPAQPVLLGAVPPRDATDVPIDSPIVLHFSRPIDEKTLEVEIESAAATWKLSPKPRPEEPTIVVIPPTGHSFAYGQAYTIRVQARDKQGMLVTENGVRPSWSFTTEPPPRRSPVVPKFVGAGMQLPRDAAIVIVFSAAINPHGFDVKVHPALPNPTERWIGDRVYVIEHDTVTGTSSRMVTIKQAQDQAGNPLPVPIQAEYFLTRNPPGPGDVPKIRGAWPEYGSANNLPDTPIVLLFDQPMDKATATVEIDPKLPLDPEPLWSGQQRVLVMRHSANLRLGHTYKLKLDASSRAGCSMAPFSGDWFTTKDRMETRPASAGPVLGVGPRPGAANVPLGVHPVIVFDRAMSTAVPDLQVDPATYPISWSPDCPDRVAIIQPAASFAQGASYRTFQILAAKDAAGKAVIAAGDPYTWSFETEAGPPKAPIVEDIRPSTAMINVALNADIQVTFSEPMDRTALDYDLSPAPEHHAAEWSDDRTVRIRHALFKRSQTYTVQIKRAFSRSGKPLAAKVLPVTWSFTTVGDGTGPVIRSTYPRNEEIDVPVNAQILVSFTKRLRSEPEGTLEQLLPVSPPAPISLTATRLNSSATTFQLAPTLGSLLPNTRYQLQITRAEDDLGLPLATNRMASVPNPWCFTTGDVPETTGLRGIHIGPFWVALSLVAFAGLLLAGAAAAAVFHQFVFLAAGVAIGALVLTSAVLQRFWRRSNLVFPVAYGEEAILETEGGFITVAGYEPTVWRRPFVEKLRAVLPTRPIAFQNKGCAVTSSDGKTIEVVLDVQYRVRGTVDAYRFLRENGDKKAADSTVYREKELRQVWEKQISQVVTMAVSDSARTRSAEEIQKCRPELEEELMNRLTAKACQWGIELQDLSIREIKPKKD